MDEISGAAAPLLRAVGVEKVYRTGGADLHVLRGVDMEVLSGEVVSVVGPSGVGKSTLLNILGALDRPSGGQVIVNGRELFGMGERELARFRNRTMGFVFQFHHLLPEFTALENVMMPALVGGEAMGETMERAASRLSEVGLAERLSHKPSELSGGERQRVAVARALMNEPLLVLADEPSGNLDRENAEELIKLIWRLKEEKGQTFVIVTHNEELAARADRVVRLRDGVVEG